MTNFRIISHHFIFLDGFFSRPYPFFFFFNMSTFATMHHVVMLVLVFFFMFILVFFYAHSGLFLCSFWSFFMLILVFFYAHSSLFFIAHSVQLFDLQNDEQRT